MNPHLKKHPTTPRFLDGLKLSLSILMAGAFLSACTTVQQVQSADLPQLASLVQADDTVTCTLRDGFTATIKVTSVEHDALVGANQHVPITDITRAEIKRLDTTKSVLLGLAVAAGGGGGGGMGGGGS